MNTLTIGDDTTAAEKVPNKSALPQLYLQEQKKYFQLGVIIHMERNLPAIAS